jgi:hypothetical protein
MSSIFRVRQSKMHLRKDEKGKSENIKLRVQYHWLFSIEH